MSKDTVKRNQSISWIASYPKSGNTWVRLFIDALLFARVDINEISVPSDTNSTYYNAVAAKTSDQLTLYEQRILRPASLHLQTCMWNYSLIPFPIFKTHWVWKDDFCIPAGFTRNSIYLVRDVRNVAVSYARHSEASIDTVIKRLNEPQHGISKGNLGQHVGSWSDHVLSWAERDPVVKVFRYEDMLASPVEVFAKIQEHLGLEGDTEKALEMVGLDKIKKAEEKNGFSEKYGGDRFFGNDSRWQDHLTKEQSETLWREHKAVMIMLGYEK